MKKLVYALFIALIPALMFTACKKSNSNDLMSILGLGGGSTPAVQGIFVKEAIAAGGSTTFGMFDSAADESRFMMLYPAADIKASGMINAISFKYGANLATDSTCTNVTIKMGHTSRTALVTTYASNVEEGKGTFRTVLDNTSITIPAGTTGNYFTIQLAEPFNYNGVDNLVVEVTRTASFSTTVILTQHTLANSMVWGYDTGSSTASDGALNSTYLDAKFNFAGGDNRIHFASLGASQPFVNNADNQRVQLLYTPSEINGSGGITGIAVGLYCTVTQEYTVTVKMGHSTLSMLDLGSWSASFNSGSPVTVANRAVLTVPAGMPATYEYIWLPLSRPFNYNGTDNLVVEIHVTSASGETFIMCGNTGVSGKRAFGPANEITDTSSVAYNIKFRFKGGTADVITAGTTLNDAPFDNAGVQNQLLYLPGELGINGSISNIGLRLGFATAVDGTYPNLRIILGQTDKTALSISDPFAGNLDNAQTVYSGSLTIPAGLEAGDWVDIPLISTFRYNPNKNLVVYFLSDSGPAHLVHAVEDATRYPSRFISIDDTTTVIPDNLKDYLYSIRFTTQ